MSDRKRSDPLLKAVGWTVGIGLSALAILAALSQIFKWEGFWRGAGQPYATTLAALAAITAAAIALHNARSQLDELRNQRDQDQKRYEEQRDRDQVRWEEQKQRDSIKDLRARFIEACRQLADDNATVRISGAYALGALADDWRGMGIDPEAEVCLGVLSTYLTAPNGTFTDFDGRHDAGHDGPVRALIVSLLGDQNTEFARPGMLRDADLRGVVFTRPIGGADMSGARLEGADFRRAGNLEGVRFVEASLDGAQLNGARLRNANFYRASLSGTNFYQADVRGANFGSVLLYPKTPDFDKAEFDEETNWPGGSNLVLDNYRRQMDEEERLSLLEDRDEFLRGDLKE